MPDDPQNAASDDMLDSLLTSHAGPAGPKLDRMWAAVEHRLDAESVAANDNTSQKVSGHRRGGSGWLVAMSAACVLAFVVAPSLTTSPADDFAVKGEVGAEAAHVFIQLSCETACAKNAPVFVRLRVRTPGRYRLRLRDASGEREVWRSAGVLAKGETAVPLEFMFDDDDQAHGASLRVLNDAAVVVGQRKVVIK